MTVHKLEDNRELVEYICALELDSLVSCSDSSGQQGPDKKSKTML